MVCLIYLLSMSSYFLITVLLFVHLSIIGLYRYLIDLFVNSFLLSRYLDAVILYLTLLTLASSWLASLKPNMCILLLSYFPILNVPGSREAITKPPARRLIVAGADTKVVPAISAAPRRLVVVFTSPSHQVKK